MWLKNPGEYTNLDLLGLCAGYEVRPRAKRKRWIVAHQEHRMVLPAAWAAQHDDVFPKPPFLLRLDAHEDYAEEGFDYADLLHRIHDIEDCILFANALMNDDGGWVESAVKMGWVSDVLTIGVQKNCKPFRQVEDISSRKHSVAAIPWDLSCKVHSQTCGVLDHAVNSVLGGDSAEDQDEPIWLDIDLDVCFAILTENRLRLRGGCEFGAWLDTPLTSIGASSGRDLGELLEKAVCCASLVTIATEPNFCGGHAAVAQAIELLEQFFVFEDNVFRGARMER